jgi:serine phosphatase RsbU (regulator of sigma subunit)
LRAETGDCAHYKPTSFPLAAMPLDGLDAPITLELRPGDILALISDGIYEYCDDTGEEFGEARVREILSSHRHRTMAELSDHLFTAVKAFAGHAPQEDDMTVVLVKREPHP